jgi:hypothetical protein
MLFRWDGLRCRDVECLTMKGITPCILYILPISSSNSIMLIPFGYVHGKVKVKLSLCLTNWALYHEGIWGSGCIDPHIIDLGTSWRWVVSFMPLPIYPRGKSPWYPLDTRLGGSQIRSGQFGEEKILDLPGLELWPLSRQAAASRYTDYATLASLSNCTIKLK